MCRRGRGESREIKSGQVNVGPLELDLNRDLRPDPAHGVRSHWIEILNHFCRGAIVADRSAVTGAPDSQGWLFIIHPRDRVLRLPGLQILPRAGRAAFDDDLPLPPTASLRSRARALLENLRPSRATSDHPPRTLSRRELQDWLVRLLRTDGETRVQQYRDRARELAPALGLMDLFPQLDDLFGAALGTRTVEDASPSLTAAQAGLRYDERREPSFVALTRALRERAPTHRPMHEGKRGALLPFFEAYFLTSSRAPNSRPRKRSRSC